jgi:DNA polymerase-1
VERALRAEGFGARMILQVHDELVFDAPVRELEGLATLVRERLEQVHPLRVPLVVGIGVGETWREAH